mmetsp:Transcript_1390/g.4699  ORF Transcript_1390/g.4699 Transcript_1390/m.4699 type:complete len:225 (+) Transcript_1390:2854-3528(+)
MTRLRVVAVAHTTRVVRGVNTWGLVHRAVKAHDCDFKRIALVVVRGGGGRRREVPLHRVAVQRRGAFRRELFAYFFKHSQERSGNSVRALQRRRPRLDVPPELRARLRGLQIARAPRAAFRSTPPRRVHQLHAVQTVHALGKGFVEPREDSVHGLATGLYNTRHGCRCRLRHGRVAQHHRDVFDFIRHQFLRRELRRFPQNEFLLSLVLRLFQRGFLLFNILRG